jgi:hypothetical protein
MLKTLIATLALCAATAGSHCHGALAAQAAKDTLAGTWVLDVQGHQVGLGLEQDGKKLTGTLVIMGQSVLVEGELADGYFTLANAPDETRKIKLSGKLKEDGTMEGDVEAGHGTHRWKGERLKPPSGQSSVLSNDLGGFLGIREKSLPTTDDRRLPTDD